ncbi:MAG: biotin--[acetyl-CoA-carboxylase] ligase [Cyanobacteria bacterium P01_F01_bin.53]
MANSPLPETYSGMSLAKIQAALKTDGRDLGIAPEFRQLQPQFDINLFEQLPSTSTQLWSVLDSGAGGSGSVVIAQRQSAGRGQRGRVWDSAPGGLYLSLALEPDWPVTHSAQLTCLSAWGIATAFNNLGIPVKIKWPNDLFFQGKKLGGILTETRLSHAEPDSLGPEKGENPLPRIRQAVIGVGINWHNPVPETGITLAQILEAMPDAPAKNKINCLEMLTALVLKGILQGSFFQRRVGSQVFMKAYMNLLTQAGKVVSLDKSLMALAEPASLAACSLAACLDTPLGDGSTDRQLKNCSGEVIGVSEEGYLQVAVRGSPAELAHERASRPSASGRSASGSHTPENALERASKPLPEPLPANTGSILLLKPSEIHIE